MKSVVRKKKKMNNDKRELWTLFAKCCPLKTYHPVINSLDKLIKSVAWVVRWVSDIVHKALGMKQTPLPTVGRA